MTGYTVSSGVTSSDLTLYLGDRLIVLGGGEAIGTMVLAGGIASLWGSALDGTVSGGEYVWSGGVATSATIGAGGYQVVYSGGDADFSIVDSGGALDIYGGVLGAELGNGAVADVFSGGTATDPTKLCPRPGSRAAA